MNNLIKKSIIALTTCFSLQALAAGAWGGANKIEGQFTLAQNYLTQVITETDFQDDSFTSLPIKIQNLLIENYAQITSELYSLNINYDHKSKSPFILNDGTESGIKTKIGIAGASIEIRSQVLVPSGNLAFNSAVIHIGHEIGHHLPQINGKSFEQSAWAYAGALSLLLNKKIKFKDLININGDYKAINKAYTCRDLAHIEANPFTGLISIATWSSKKCTAGSLVMASFATSIFKPLTNNYIIIPNQYVFWSGNPKENYSGLSKIYIFPDGGIQINFNLQLNDLNNDTVHLRIVNQKLRKL